LLLSCHNSSDSQVQCPVTSLKVIENLIYPLRNRPCNIQKVCEKIMVIPNPFTDSFSVLCFLINSAFIFSSVMPCGGPVPFLPHMAVNKKGRYECVNALYRAYPISTVPCKKPCKINGFRG
ncbi:MAG: hypothetical protein K2N46_04890, partial [Lachnospiraceae bacterium]|nr:hypothetical protein [Lachnospiraceae bacterium]